MNIKWDTSINFDIKLIKMFEEHLGIVFPDEYKSIVTNHDGAQPDIVDDNGNRKTGTIEINFKFFKKDTFAFYRYSGEYRIFDVYNLTREVVPPKVIPFADNGGGNIYYFDFRKCNEPSILYQEHEEVIDDYNLTDEERNQGSLEYWQDQTLYKVADSFKKFLNLIK